MRKFALLTPVLICFFFLVGIGTYAILDTRSQGVLFPFIQALKVKTLEHSVLGKVSIEISERSAEENGWISRVTKENFGIDSIFWVQAKCSGCVALEREGGTYWPQWYKIQSFNSRSEALEFIKAKKYKVSKTDQ